jgi:hypothetical protein
MAGYLNDVKAVDFILTGDFGTYIIRNYGSNASSITVESTDNKLYNVAEGAFGDMLLNKSYKAKNMRIRINVLRKSPDYSKLRGLIAKELAGEALTFSALVKDNNGGESIYCPEAVFETNPNLIWGVNPDDNVEFTVLMPSASYTAPEVA